MPQGSRTYKEIALALQATFEASSADIGVVLVDQRLVANPREVISLIESQNNGVPKGCIINFSGVRQADHESGDGVGIGSGGVEQMIQFGIDVFYPYNDTPDNNGDKSVDRFWRALLTLTLYLNNNRTLGLRCPPPNTANPDVLVRHHFLQSRQPLAVVPFGTGADAVISHVGMFSIEVQSCYNVATPQF